MLIDLGLIEYSYFRQTIFGVRLTPEAAFERLCTESFTDTNQIRRRSFKVVLRPADVGLEDFIERQVDRSRHRGPFRCLLTGSGYVFFGR